MASRSIVRLSIAVAVICCQISAVRGEESQHSAQKANFSLSTEDEQMLLFLSRTAGQGTKFNETEFNITMEQVRGTRLRVITVIEEPFVNYVNFSLHSKKGGPGTKRYGPGIVMEILDSIGKKYNISYEFKVANGEGWGDKDANGTWHGLIEHLIDDKADILAGALIVREDRSRVVQYTIAFMDAYTGALIGSPDKNEVKTFAILTKPFQWQVWLLTAGAVVVSGLILKALCMALRRSREVQYSVIESVWVFFSVFVQQGLPVQPKSWTCRTMLAIWWLGALTLVATFTGNMVALFAVQNARMPVKELEDVVRLVESEGSKIVLTTSSATRKLFIQNSRTELNKRLWKQMQNGKLIEVDSVEAGIRSVKENPKHIFLAARESLEVPSQIDCDITLSDAKLLPVWYGLAFRKELKNISDLFDKEIRKYVENGLTEKWLTDFQFEMIQERGKGHRCAYEVGVTTKGTALKLPDAQGAFWILVGGAAIAGAALLYEFLRKLVAMASAYARLSFPQWFKPKQMGSHYFTENYVDGWHMKDADYDGVYASGMSKRDGDGYETGGTLAIHSRGKNSIYPDLLDFPESGVQMKHRHSIVTH